jgi:hypothetical protein
MGIKKDERSLKFEKFGVLPLCFSQRTQFSPGWGCFGNAFD